ATEAVRGQPVISARRASPVTRSSQDEEDCGRYKRKHHARQAERDEHAPGAHVEHAYNIAARLLRVSARERRLWRPGTRWRSSVLKSIQTYQSSLRGCEW